MLNIKKHRFFKACFKKLNPKQRQLFYERLELFIQNPVLKTHRLKGDLKDFYAFALGGDLRVVFRWPTKDNIILHKVGTHNQVY